MKKNVFWLVFFIIMLICSSIKHNQLYDNQNTKVEESRYNTMSPSVYYKEMKSENLQYADVAWQAQHTYGWNCPEIIKIENEIKTSGKELKDPLLISEIKGTYNIATCSTGVKLRIYPRYNTYPIITNINGGFE